MSGSREWPPACDSGSDFHGGIVGCDSGSDFHSGIVGCDSGSDFNGGIVGVGGIVQWRIVGKDGIIVEVMEVVGVEGSRVLFERYLPLHDTVL